MKNIYFILILITFSITAQSQIVISQIYGGGGITNSTYTNDFVELFNRGTTPQNLNGWSIQCTSTNGSNWATTALPNFDLLPGQYFLIQEASGGTIGLALPTPDLNGVSLATTGSDGMPLPTGIPLGVSNGKVILVNTTVAETTANPSGFQIIDKVAYGIFSSSGFEGTGPTGVTLSSSNSASRNSAGCTDTNENSTDFTITTPLARNNSTAVNSCSLGVSQNSISGLNIFPNPVSNGTFNITTDANAERNVVVYDVLGKQVLKATTSNVAINVANLNAGVYIVKVTEEGKTATRKLVIR